MISKPTRHELEEYAKQCRQEGRRPDYTGVDLSEADLSGLFLIDANFSDANLSGSDLSGAVLMQCNFSKADLSHATLTNAKLTSSHFHKTNLQGTDLSNTHFWYSDIQWVDLSGVKINIHDIAQVAYVIRRSRPDSLAREALAGIMMCHDDLPISAWFSDYPPYDEHDIDEWYYLVVRPRNEIINILAQWDFDIDRAPEPLAKARLAVLGEVGQLALF